MINSNAKAGQSESTAFPFALRQARYLAGTRGVRPDPYCLKY